MDSATVRSCNARDTTLNKTRTHRHRRILFPAYPPIQSPSAFGPPESPAPWPTQPFAPRPRLRIRSLLRKIIVTNKESPSMKVARDAWCHSRVSEQPPQPRCPFTAASLGIERSAIHSTSAFESKHWVSYIRVERPATRRRHFQPFRYARVERPATRAETEQTASIPG
jgi:hypothetical protein